MKKALIQFVLLLCIAKVSSAQQYFNFDPKQKCIDSVSFKEIFLKYFLKGEKNYLDKENILKVTFESKCEMFDFKGITGAHNIPSGKITLFYINENCAKKDYYTLLDSTKYSVGNLFLFVKPGVYVSLIKNKIEIYKGVNRYSNFIFNYNKLVKFFEKNLINYDKVFFIQGSQSILK